MSRVHPPQLFIAKAILFRRAGPEILAEIRLLDKFAEDFAALRGLQVQRDALHATIVGLEIGAGEARYHARTAPLSPTSKHLYHHHLPREDRPSACRARSRLARWSRRQPLTPASGPRGAVMSKDLHCSAMPIAATVLCLRRNALDPKLRPFSHHDPAGAVSTRPSSPRVSVTVFTQL